MINRIVAAALSQRFVVLIAMAGLAVWGVISFQRLPIDAYPDLAPPRVQIVSQWPGHAAEEVERLITIPLEVEMNGIPKLDVLRSISLYGLSSITMNFAYDTDPYFARAQAFERIPNASVPGGVTPSGTSASEMRWNAWARAKYGSVSNSKFIVSDDRP